MFFERYFGRAHRNANPDMASTGKAYTSIACGIMLHEKHNAIPGGLDQKVFTEKYLPEAFPLDDPRKAEITLGQLLCMTAGYHGEDTSPGVVHGQVVPLKPVPGQDIRDLDRSSLRTVLWTNAAGGDWSVGSNWSTNSPPGMADDAIIGTSPAVTLNTGATLNGRALAHIGAVNLAGNSIVRPPL